jgi:hypothetical protein
MYGITNITEIIPFAVLISPQLSWKSPQQTRHLQIFLIPRLSLYKLLSQSFQTAPQSFSESLFHSFSISLSLHLLSNIQNLSSFLPKAVSSIDFTRFLHPLHHIPVSWFSLFSLKYSSFPLSLSFSLFKSSKSSKESFSSLSSLLIFFERIIYFHLAYLFSKFYFQFQILVKTSIS